MSNAFQGGAQPRVTLLNVFFQFLTLRLSLAGLLGGRIPSIDSLGGTAKTAWSPAPTSCPFLCTTAFPAKHLQMTWLWPLCWQVLKMLFYSDSAVSRFSNSPFLLLTFPTRSVPYSVPFVQAALPLRWPSMFMFHTQLTCLHRQIGKLRQLIFFRVESLACR